MRFSSQICKESFKHLVLSFRNSNYRKCINFVLEVNRKDLEKIWVVKIWVGH